MTESYCSHCVNLKAPRNNLTISISGISQFQVYQAKQLLGKYFEGGMLIRTLPATFLQIFCKIILNSKVIVKNIIDPDDNF